MLTNMCSVLRNLNCGLMNILSHARDLGSPAKFTSTHAQRLDWQKKSSDLHVKHDKSGH